MEKSVHRQVAELPEEDRGKKIQPLEPQRIITPYAIFYDTTRTADYMTAYPIPTKTAIVKTNVELAMVRLNSHKAFQDGFPFGEIEEYSNLYEGMEAAICGFPLGELLTKELGTYSSSFAKEIIASNLPAPGATMEHIKRFQLDITFAPGSSGGPAFSGESGNVFGVLQSGLAAEAITGIARAEPVYTVLAHDNVNQLLNSPIF